MATQQIDTDIGIREYSKFRKGADGNFVVAVTVVDAAAGTTNYDSAEFAVATGTTNYNVASNQAAAFSRVPTASYASIRTDHNITIRLNTITDPVITVATVDSPFVINNIPVTNIFVTNNSGSTANIKLILV